MIRITTLVWIALLVVAGGTVMRVSYQVRHVEKHLADVGRATQQEQMAIRILGAEWDTLNDPQRIDALSKRYLSLESTPIRRVVALDDIPLKPSQDQIARLLADQAVKTAKSQHPAAKAPSAPVRARPAAPALVVRAAPPQVASPQVAPVGAGIALAGPGLVYARAERHE
jgi:hypothetical protein